MALSVKIGTRSSKLAVAQATEVKNRLHANHADKLPASRITLVPITTTGDKKPDIDLSQAGGKGVFTKEIEEALLAKKVCIASHSMKDLPWTMHEDLEIGCILPRQDARDVLVSRFGNTLDTMPYGAIIGTNSPRRKAFALAYRPDLRIVPLRGNVDTRLQKLARGLVHGIILAAAGLHRIGSDMAVPPLDTSIMLPAAGQGAIAVQCRKDDQKIKDLLKPLNNVDTDTCIQAERAVLRVLEGSCNTPVGAYARLVGDKEMVLEGWTALPDGTRLWKASRKGYRADAVEMGEDVGLELKTDLPDALLVSNG